MSSEDYTLPLSLARNAVKGGISNETERLPALNSPYTSTFSHRFEDPTFDRTMELVGLREKIVCESEEARLKNQAASKKEPEKTRD